MADAEEREKKVAAAKKRYEQLKKQKEKGKKPGSGAKKDDPQEAKEEPASTIEKNEAHEQEVNIGEDEQTISAPDETHAPATPKPPETTENISMPAHHRQPSLSLQSKMRSSSFRRTSISQSPLSPSLIGAKSPTLPTLSPDGDSMTEIYRKQAARLDELERENKRLAKEARESEGRWKRTEEELEELREASGEVAELKARAEKADAKNDEVEKLIKENTSLQRQNSQLQHHSSRSRHIPSPGHVDVSSSDLQTQLDSKNSTIESMEMEISNLRAQLDKYISSSTSQSEQVKALEEKLDRAERAAGAAQRELGDVKKSLDRASEKAVKEGSQRTSAETKIRSLERETEDSKKIAEESSKRVETLEKKLAAITTLHKDSDGRRQAGEHERDRLEKDAVELRRRLASLENENLRLKEEKERSRKKEASGIDDDGVDELEDQERIRLENKVRGLESEVYDLRQGVWKDRRRELAADAESGPTSPGSKFDDIDLSGGPLPFRRQSMAGSRAAQGFTSLLNNGLNAFTGGGGHARESSAFLEDDDGGFDEDAFRRAQEQESLKRIERVKEVKRGLKEWEGWRMDLVDCRVGGGGAGEIFDV